uniref:SURF1-like protein n=1 Tax=Tetraselmis sp. GSL018 TaxID=582737 RepID=A0A061RBM4_9CHLO|eukprot:CAMPEP_0177594220 /NCGR_PEP_ID=MMETSP0419_2-20121207/9661_1 /TAXON_ID=582737 /ORGANISM="Tetraselmis sp., Strain GSL018" /LENGTH=329 /DNA_ID=CAMNT_0019085507 /DNA_START=306 /DNA_END=1295 /DNA_ORIENTATION=+
MLAASRAAQLLRAPRGLEQVATAAALSGVAESALALPRPCLAIQAAARLSSSATAPGKERGGEGGSRGGGFDWRGALLLLPAGIAAYLGSWQVQRRQWKMDLIEQRREMLQRPPADAFSLQPADAQEYLPVQAEGRFLHGDAVYVGPRVKSSMGTSQPGHVVITPLYSDVWGRAVLVNRGWAPSWWRSGCEQDPASGGPASVGGVVRLGEQPNGFVPENDPGGGRWFWIDAPAIARACGLPAETPLLEVFDRGEGQDAARASHPACEAVRGPRPSAGAGGQAAFPEPKGIGELVNLPVMPDDHRNYAAIWFSLAGILVPMALRAMRGGR